MITYVKTPASEIFSRFKGPKITSLFHFFSLTINFCGVIPRTPYCVTTIKEKEVALFGLTLRGKSPLAGKSPLVGPR